MDRQKMLSGAALSDLYGQAKGVAAGMVAPAGRQMAQAPPQSGGGDIDDAIYEVEQAVGMNINDAMKSGNVDEFLRRAAQSDMGATDGGIMTIESIAESLGRPSPYQQQQGAPDYAGSAGKGMVGNGR